MICRLISSDRRRRRIITKSILKPYLYLFCFNFTIWSEYFPLLLIHGKILFSFFPLYLLSNQWVLSITKSPLLFIVEQVWYLNWIWLEGENFIQLNLERRPETSFIIFHRNLFELNGTIIIFVGHLILWRVVALKPVACVDGFGILVVMKEKLLLIGILLIIATLRWRVVI